MVKSWAGPLITGLIAIGVAAILASNLQTGRPSLKPTIGKLNLGTSKPGPTDSSAKGVRENPIGEPVERNHVRVAAVWLPAVMMDGMAAGSSDLIHIEADIKATEDNPNGFAKDEFVPYLKVAYAIVPAQGGPAIEKGELTPMVAWDGLHYGANIAMPKAGDYRLTYDIQPPSAGGLGRHSDPATGVAPWWETFPASFDWTVEVVAGSR